MLKIEKIENGYILEIELLNQENTSTENQMDSAMDMLKKFMPDVIETATNAIEGDALLRKLQTQAIEEKKFVEYPIKNNKKYFTTFKELMSYLSLMTENIDNNN